MKKAGVYRVYGSETVLESVESLRKEMGLHPITPKERACMKCGARFMSEGPHNRLCGVCRNSARQANLVFESIFE